MSAAMREARPCAGHPDRLTEPASPIQARLARATWAPEFYAWDVSGDDAHNEAGVTNDRGRAVGYVQDALADAGPGASGTIRKVTLSDSGNGGYVDLGAEASAHIDAATGAVVWTK